MSEYIDKIENFYEDYNKVYEKYKKIKKKAYKKFKKDRAEYINDILNEDDKIKLVSENAYYIAYIKNPSEAVQMAAIKKTNYSFKFIKNPSEAIKKYLNKT